MHTHISMKTDCLKTNKTKHFLGKGNAWETFGVGERVGVNLKFYLRKIEKTYWLVWKRSIKGDQNCELIPKIHTTSHYTRGHTQLLYSTQGVVNYFRSRAKMGLYMCLVGRVQVKYASLEQIIWPFGGLMWTADRMLPSPALFSMLFPRKINLNLLVQKHIIKCWSNWPPDYINLFLYFTKGKIWLTFLCC
jgi:hypothetical protein